MMENMSKEVKPGFLSENERWSPKTRSNVPERQQQF
jgi:hypothetical protein